MSTGAGYSIYYSTDAGVYLDLGAGNAEQVGEPDALAGYFSVASDPEGGAHVLSNWIQPVCPCNAMFYTYRSAEVTWPPQEWSLPYDLTYYYDASTWPHDPVIACDSEGVVHACWSQQHYDGMMEPSFRGIFYYTYEDGIWSDENDILQGHGHMAQDSHMALGVDEKPVFVFARDEMSSFNVWLALDPGQTGISEAAPGAPSLSAYPNPFNPRTTIRSEYFGGHVQVTLHDVSGRKLRTLFQGQSDGVLTMDWNGRDESGREQPSGVYLVRVSGAAGSEQLKLVLIR